MRGKDKFIKVFSNLPIDVRKEIILVIDDQPITWNVAYNEIINETSLGERIIQKLEEMELI
jgi:hypothetical protein